MLLKNRPVMSWTNYHGHCNYCDGHAQMEEYIIAAIEKNMRTIAFSSHAPVPFDCFWTMKREELTNYLTDIEKYRIKYKSQINILSSLEIDYIPDLTGANAPLLKDLKLDFKIGSIHFVDNFKGGQPWNIDGSFVDFMKGINNVFQGNVKNAVKRFWQLNREMVLTQGIDIVGHLDKIKMHNIPEPLFDEKADWYLHEVEETLDVLKKKEVIVEINTKSFERNGLLFPGEELFELMHNKGVSVTINSDAHYPDKLTTGFEFVAEALLKAGYNTLKEYSNGKWIDVPFNKNGISWNEINNV